MMAKSEREKQRQAEEEEKKQRKKIAKQEAILMHKLEGLRKDVKKAEQKVSKAQAGLESAQVLAQRIEGQLAELRGTGKKEEGAAGTQEVPQAVQTEVEGADQAAPGEDSERDRGDAPSEEQIEGQPPAEGRVDIGEGAESQESPVVAEEPVMITSEEGSMAVESTDEHAWPPPEVREEVAEAIKEESMEPAETEEGEEEDDEEQEQEEAGMVNGAGPNGETVVAPRPRRRSPRRPRASS
jgi:hypothetical protein